ncbi:hypothetical protein [Wolbachia endosymbiont (group B) of Archips podanus]|uniref:hypothetical protein n=1 Tax=Wolbachia endosymbiont (group B) of Archips podanus TaxID=2953984 RepID=UPI0022277CFE|nr:hypothetical protein [Wolbachia endosymbiont (group B) of Archips podanus]
MKKLHNNQLPKLEEAIKQIQGNPYIGAVVLKVNRKILKINFYLVDYKAKDAFNTFYVI